MTHPDHEGVVGESVATDARTGDAGGRASLPFLWFRDGDGHQQTLYLDGDQHTVGRGDGADILVDWDLGVSRVHAQLERVGADWTVVDDGLSRNGTFVNGERLSGRHRLRDGDSVRVGDTVLAFRHTRADSAPSTAIADDRPVRTSLSQTQHEILVALCRPYRDGAAYATPATNQQIAGELYLSVDAVKTHLRTLFRKFGVEDLPQNQKRTRLVELAFQSGIVSPRDL